MTTFGPKFQFRKGDVLRFARGSNEYVGTVKRVSRGFTRLYVESGVFGPAGCGYIGFSHVIALKVPVVTAAERDALKVLREHGPLTVAGAKKAGLPLTGTALTHLRDRGFVSEVRFGVVGGGAASWALTREGGRVAESLD